MTVRGVILFAFFALLSVETCNANEVAPPPLTEKGLLGRWEAPGPSADYWFRMEVFPSGGYLAVVQRADYALYKLEESKLSGTNNVSLRFRGLRDKFPSAWDTIRIEAIGYSIDDQTGELHADLTQSSASNAHIDFHVEFEKGAEQSSDVINMLEKADELIRDAKRDHH
jgi:hypothetical protein